MLMFLLLLQFANLLDTVQSYLLAYVTRRQQVCVCVCSHLCCEVLLLSFQAEEVMETCSHLLSENISSFNAYNFIQLTLVR